MDGLREFHRDKVYRGSKWDMYESGYANPKKYHGEEVIQPSTMIHNNPESNLPSEDEITITRYIAAGCGLASLITENLLIHPFVVLRRQCQVNPNAYKYHIIPITLIPVIVRLHQTQGLNTLWKGVGSVLFVRGLTLAVEDILSKITPWPKEINGSNLSLRSLGQHILLKCISVGFIASFYSVSLVETVQSGIASETPGILDIFRDGAIRLLEVGNKGRLIPIYALLPPTIVYSVSKYLLTVLVKETVNNIEHSRFKCYQESKGAYKKDHVYDTMMQDIEWRSILISMCVADIVFYPFETVIHRLHLQGTRTIIDNLDTGRSVTPLLTGYSGAIDCYRSIVSSEGMLGLYKGFGALVMQFAVHFMVLRSTKWILTEVGNLLRSKPRDVNMQ